MATKKASGKKGPAARGRKPATRVGKADPKPGRLRLQNASPSFTVNDLARSLAWYRDVVGFEVSERYEREGTLVGVGLGAGDVFLMLSQDDWKKGRDRKKGDAFRIHCMTRQDVDALAARIRSKGGIIDQEPRDEPWGMRDFSITDPDGFKLTIAKELKTRRK
jgi:lactoylglutathione lyase